MTNSSYLARRNTVSIDRLPHGTSPKQVRTFLENHGYPAARYEKFAVSSRVVHWGSYVPCTLPRLAPPAAVALTTTVCQCHLRQGQVLYCIHPVPVSRIRADRGAGPARAILHCHGRARAFAGSSQRHHCPRTLHCVACIGCVRARWVYAACSTVSSKARGRCHSSEGSCRFTHTCRDTMTHTTGILAMMHTSTGTTSAFNTASS